MRWAKERGIDVTAEVTPHHLLLTDELVRTFDPVYKVNPPLRTEEDVQAVRQAVADGTIDVIGTDHAPHPRQDKECEWSGAAHGMTGLETALSIAQHTLVDTGLLTWADVARVLSETPARIGGLGSRADRWPRGSPPTSCSSTRPPRPSWIPRPTPARGATAPTAA